MRTVPCEKISEAVSQLAIRSCYELPDDVVQSLRSAVGRETSPAARVVLSQLLRNAEIARQGEFPLCQDTGYTVVFLDVGQEVRLVGGDVSECVAAGVRRGYQEGYLRKSVVNQPFTQRNNTGDNTPPVIHMSIVPGDRVRIVVLPKGGGSENMSRLAMLVPAQGRKGILDVVADAVDRAGANPCPPLIVGVGIGGTAEHAMLLSKRALLRKVGQASPEPENASLERDLLERINALGVGPMGLGGDVTALAVHVDSFPCHIASLPVGITLQCHSARHREAIL